MHYGYGVDSESTLKLGIGWNSCKKNKNISAIATQKSVQ